MAFEWYTTKFCVDSTNSPIPPPCKQFLADLPVEDSMESIWPKIGWAALALFGITLFGGLLYNAITKYISTQVSKVLTLVSKFQNLPTQRNEIPESSLESGFQNSNDNSEPPSYATLSLRIENELDNDLYD